MNILPRQLTSAERKWLKGFRRAFLRREDVLAKQSRELKHCAALITRIQNFNWLVGKLVEFKDLAVEEQPEVVEMCRICENIPCDCLITLERERANEKVQPLVTEVYPTLAEVKEQNKMSWSAFDEAARVFEKGQP